VVQPSPDCLAQAFILAEAFLAGTPSALVLGDNIFFGHGLPKLLAAADQQDAGGTVFGYHVADPERYGMVEFDGSGRARQIVEKPEVAPSNYAVTGLYFLDSSAPTRVSVSLGRLLCNRPPGNGWRPTVPPLPTINEVDRSSQPCIELKFSLRRKHCIF
jgi:NDP-sugar pyrophosphorylase family protein